MQYIHKRKDNMKIKFNAITNGLDNVPGFIVHDSSAK